MYCYAQVIQDTCNTSAADINLLKTILYNAKFSYIVAPSCALGESQYGGVSTVVIFADEGTLYVDQVDRHSFK